MRYDEYDDDDLSEQDNEGMGEHEEEYGDYLADLKDLAKHYIATFFRDKSFWCGGPIPKHLLNNPKYISYMLNLDVCNGMDYIYRAIGTSAKVSDEAMEKGNQIPDDVRHVIDLFNMCAKAGIPKQFSVGITIMYLELCEGCRLAA